MTVPPSPSYQAGYRQFLWPTLNDWPITPGLNTWKVQQNMYQKGSTPLRLHQNTCTGQNSACFCCMMRFVYLASSSRGSSGGYMDFTTSSTRGLMRLAALTRSFKRSRDRSCWALPIAMATNFSVKLWHVRSISRQWGIKPLRGGEKHRHTAKVLSSHPNGQLH